jgi:hypothetical protein
MKLICILFCLLIISSTLPLSFAETQQKISIPIITWISHDINQTTTDTLASLGFTDVVIRYQTNDTQCNEILSASNLRMWRWIGPWWGYDFTVNGSTPEYPVMVDDTHAMLYDLEKENKINQFLKGAERFGSNFVLVMFQDETLQFVEKYDFSKLHIDLYCLPNKINGTIIRECQTRCASVGIYLWVWNGFGVNWESITTQQINYAYQTAKDYNVSRFTVWMGDEVNTIEQGMKQSSFLNYPNWFETLQTNNNYLTNNQPLSIPEFNTILPVFLSLFAIVTIVFLRWDKPKKANY